ncbi:MAG: hypothetical protein J1F38_01075 [Muribaculaceae bacterium]|nr:hypothetical protein [Muribaculaceae bacterium]
MKKQLLLGMALLATVGAFAQEGTDITPANYKVGNPGVELPLSRYVGGITTLQNGNEAYELTTNPNIAAADIWTAIKGDENWNDGLVLIGSGGGMTAAQWDDFMECWNYIDFGGEIGRVGCFITKDCDIADVLNNYAPNRADEWSNLKIITNQFGGGQVNFFTDPKNTPTDGFIRVNFLFNIYNNNFSGNQFIQSFGMRGNQNNNQSEWDGTKYTQDLMPGTDINNDICMEDSGDWDPEKWISLTYDFTATAADAGVSYTPVRIKMFFTANQATKESAMFFKNISFTHFSSGEPEYLSKALIEEVTLKQDLQNPSSDTGGVDSIGIDLNAPVEYYNLQGVKVANPEKGGMYIIKQGKVAKKTVVR